jgi:hypothetical protein
MPTKLKGAVADRKPHAPHNACGFRSATGCMNSQAGMRTNPEDASQSLAIPGSGGREANRHPRWSMAGTVTTDRKQPLGRLGG